ncbi:MAG: hypothetical protein F6K19_12165 [Cyanothece sp. SIO1E1]|nr:hypothetical protein [Cyanothece sp. SIO1E1]
MPFGSALRLGIGRLDGTLPKMLGLWLASCLAALQLVARVICRSVLGRLQVMEFKGLVVAVAQLGDRLITMRELVLAMAELDRNYTRHFERCVLPCFNDCSNPADQRLRLRQNCQYY